MEDKQNPEQQLRELLRSADSARRGLARLEEDKRKLQRDLAGFEEALRQLQEALPAPVRAAVHEQYLAEQLKHLDAELPAAGGAAHVASSAHVAGAPGGIERRATPRPATIRLPELTPMMAEELAPVSEQQPGLLGRARRALLRAREASQA